MDFTQPYYDTGLRILVNRLLGDSKVDTSRFWQFLKPFNMWLWLLIGVMCVSFAVTMFMFERRKNEIDFAYESSASNAGVRAIPGLPFYLLEYRTRHRAFKVREYDCRIVCAREMPFMLVGSARKKPVMY